MGGGVGSVEGGEGPRGEAVMVGGEVDGRIRGYDGSSNVACVKIYAGHSVGALGKHAALEFSYSGRLSFYGMEPIHRSASRIFALRPIGNLDERKYQIWISHIALIPGSSTPMPDSPIPLNCILFL